jgi:hypothetical protein
VDCGWAGGGGGGAAGGVRADKTVAIGCGSGFECNRLIESVEITPGLPVIRQLFKVETAEVGTTLGVPDAF